MCYLSHAFVILRDQQFIIHKPTGKKRIKQTNSRSELLSNFVFVGKYIKAKHPRSIHLLTAYSTSIDEPTQIANATTPSTEVKQLSLPYNFSIPLDEVTVLNDNIMLAYC